MQAVVQLRGHVDMAQSVHDTLKMLNLHNVNHCTFVPETDAYRGMLTKVNDYVAFGEPSPETVAMLLRRRAEPLAAVAGAPGDADHDLEVEADADVDVAADDGWVADNTEYADVDALAAALVAEETTLREANLAPALRLHPPRGGHRGIKHSRREGGQLGPHDTDEIDELLEAMR
jgi:large subunit ribosomal protein L30